MRRPSRKRAPTMLKRLLRAIGAFFYGFFGYSVAKETGRFDGYIDGYDDGVSDGTHEGYQEGRTEGYLEGRETGQTAGFERAVETVSEWYTPESERFTDR